MSDNSRRENISLPMRTIVVDDEALGRELLLRLASASEKIDVVGEFSDASTALDAIRTLNPDIAFFDIKMPKLSGIEAARQLSEFEIIVIFVTAFEEHALEAFEVQALDYLLKPIEKDRFHAVCERAFASIKRKRLENIVGHSDETQEAIKPAALTDRIKVRDGNRVRFVDPLHVIHFEAANQYVRIHTHQGSFLISSESLNSLQESVDSEVFVRIHRSSIINIKHAVSIRLDDKGTYFVEMSDGSRIRVSRSNRGILKNLGI